MRSEIRKIINLYNQVKKTVPAYKKILEKYKFSNVKIKSKEDFETLPILNKKNYIQKFSLNELVKNSSFPTTAYASSGSTGSPTFWFRNEQQEKNAQHTHEIIVKDIFNIKKEDSTLVIICFSMGVWVAGNSEAHAFHSLNQLGYNFTTVTPGIEKKDILSIIKNISKFYKHTIIAGYPPFISDILQTCKQENIKINNNFRVLTSGDSFSEHWRDTVMKLLNVTNPAYILNIYGCADASLLGFETPLSIYIRREAIKNPNLYNEIFKEAKEEPAFLQYNQSHIYFENHKNELLITVNSGIPLIRYNLHDSGSIISYQEVQSVLSKFNILTNAEKKGLTKWNNPFIIKTGRTDVAVTFYSLNIYPEHLISGVEDPRIKKYFSGNFISYNTEDLNHKEHYLHIEIELIKNTTSTKIIKKETAKVIFENLIKRNIEYSKLFNSIGEKAYPIIHLKKFGNLNDTHGLIYHKGKKPKIKK